ncbi:hypothetical protein AcW1_009820 [Taiwanofungus camphoratus]|nr:hypothetical protein AcW1_009820 [Antrodia cinnamomea]
MAASHYTRIILAERPTGQVSPANFRREVVPFDLKPSNDQVLVRVQYLSVDPAMRLWLSESSPAHMPPVQIGAVMKAYGVGVVVEAGQGSAFAKGDLVSGMFGWAEYVVRGGTEVTKVDVPEGAELLDFLGPLSLTGLTAYVGLEVVAKVQAGEKLVVSGAAGAVGSLVCQIGKEKGAKVYAIAGSAEKCAWLEQDVGVDKALNYKSPTFHDDFANAVGSFDLFFDNVGGELLDYLLTRMNLHARVIICGHISDYNVAKPKGLTEYANILSSQATVQGFTVMSYLESFPAGRKYFAERLKSGTLKRKFHVIEGLEEAPKALAMLFSGQNNGKLVLKVTG